MKRNVDSLRDLWDNLKDTNVCIIRVPEEKKGTENTTEDILAENFPNLGNKHLGPGSKKSSKHHKPNEDHTRTQCN